MEQLPPELMQIICSFLQPVPDLLRLSRVSRRWYASCASASLWRHVTVSASAFPSSSERRSAWNRFAKRLGRAVSELHITLPRTLRLSEHHHPLTRSSFARCAGLREICSVCQNYLGDAFYVCKIPACVWTECEECRLNASLPLSLSSFASLSSLTFDRDGPWCWGLPCCGLSLQEKALRTVRTSKLRELSVMGVPVSGHSGIEKWFVRQRGLERLSLYIASGCVLDLCTAFWSSLRELCLFASDSVSWNIIGVMHLISVDCPLLEQLSVSFASAGTFPIYNLSALSRMRSFHMLSRQESAEIDGETLDYIFRSLDMRQLETLELKGIPALTEPTTLQLVLAQHPLLRRLTLEAPRVTRDQLLTIISNAPGLEALSLSGDCTEPFPALDLPRPPDFSELSSLPTSALRFVRLCTPMTERTVWALGMLPRLEELDIQAPCWLRAQLARSYSTHGTAFPALRRVRVAAQPVPTRVHVIYVPHGWFSGECLCSVQSDEFLASLLPLMRALERLELAGLHSVTGVGWLHALSETNPQLSSITCSGGTAPLYRSDPRTAYSIPLLYPTVTAGRGEAHTDADHMESEPA